MKTYIGINVVKAEPKCNMGADGYTIVFPDGYKMWCPKDTFDDAYRELTCIDFIKSET